MIKMILPLLVIGSFLCADTYAGKPGLTGGKKHEHNDKKTTKLSGSNNQQLSKAAPQIGRQYLIDHDEHILPTAKESKVSRDYYSIEKGLGRWRDGRLSAPQLTQEVSLRTGEINIAISADLSSLKRLDQVMRASAATIIEELKVYKTAEIDFKELKQFIAKFKHRIRNVKLYDFDDSEEVTILSIFNARP